MHGLLGTLKPSNLFLTVSKFLFYFVLSRLMCLLVLMLNSCVCLDVHVFWSVCRLIPRSSTLLQVIFLALLMNNFALSLLSIILSFLP